MRVVARDWRSWRAGLGAQKWGGRTTFHMRLTKPGSWTAFLTPNRFLKRHMGDVQNRLGVSGSLIMFAWIFGYCCAIGQYTAYFVN